jgi:hypothetical protein
MSDSKEKHVSHDEPSKIHIEEDYASCQAIFSRKYQIESGIN